MFLLFGGTIAALLPSTTAHDSNVIEHLGFKPDTVPINQQLKEGLLEKVDSVVPLKEKVDSVGEIQRVTGEDNVNALKQLRVLTSEKEQQPTDRHRNTSQLKKENQPSLSEPEQEKSNPLLEPVEGKSNPKYKEPVQKRSSTALQEPVQEKSNPVQEPVQGRSNSLQESVQKESNFEQDPVQKNKSLPQRKSDM